MPVQQHPIPQNVTQYQFRLVGDMTLKQFLQLAGGIIVGLLFYASGLPFFLKWPAIAISVTIGASIAFLPIEGRPLDQWIVAFFRSIYSPTVYTWQKTTSPFAKLSSPPLPPPSLVTPLPSQITVVAPEPKPVTPPSTVTLVSPPLVPSPLSSLSTPIIPETVPPSPSFHTAPKEVATPVSTPLYIEQEPPRLPPSPRPAPIPVFSLPTEHSTSPLPLSTSATFSSNLPIPHPPTTPNTIIGMTLTIDNKILDSTIVEILQNGLTLRATKSNKLGQFLFAKPLDDGSYQIAADKEGHTFPTFDLKLEGQVLPPLQIKATT